MSPPSPLFAPMFAMEDNCLHEQGYNVVAVPSLRRNGALRSAIARSGISRVMFRLRYQGVYKSDPFAMDDLVYLIESHPLHLREFGYSTKEPARARCNALSTASLAFGFDTVLNRLAAIASSGNCGFLHVIAEDVSILMSEFDVEEDELPDVLRVLLMQQRAPLSLRKYGYKLSLPTEDRQAALVVAISEWGSERVIERLRQVSVWHKANPVLMTDINFCN